MTALKSSAIFSAISWICSPTVRIFSTIRTISLKKLLILQATGWLYFNLTVANQKTLCTSFHPFLIFKKLKKTKFRILKFWYFKISLRAFIRYPRRYLLFISAASYSYKNKQKFGSSRFESGLFKITVELMIQNELQTFL